MEISLLDTLNILLNCNYFTTRNKLAELLFSIGSPQMVSSIWIYTAILLTGMLVFLTYHTKDKYTMLRKTINTNFFLFPLYLLSIFILNIPNYIQGHVHIDESQHIAEALTLSQDPRIWLSVDGTTVGPLALYIPLLAKLLGLKIGFFSIRLINSLIWFISAWFVYKTFRIYYSRQLSRIYSLPLILIISLFSFAEYFTYNGETSAVLLLTLSFFFAVKVIKGFRGSNLFLLGTFLALVPFSKIQAGPVALFIGLIILVYLIHNKANFGLLILGVIVPVSTFLFYIYYFNLFHDFWQSYILNNLAYSIDSEGIGAKRGLIFNIIKIPFTLFTPTDTRLVFIFGLFILVYYVYSKEYYKKYRNISREKILFAGYLFISLFVIIVPGNIFYHYTLLMIPPFILVTGLLFQSISLKHNYQNARFLFILVFCLAPSLNTIFSKSSTSRFSERSIMNSLTVKPLSKEICSLSDPRDRIAMWGWDTSIYPETGLMMGTREAHTQRQILSRFQQSYYLDRYVSDLKKNKPEFFLDAINKDDWLFDPDSHRHENFPLIKKYIDEYYKFHININGKRIYIRK